MTFDTDEKSVSQSRPIELYTLATPTTTYRMTSYHRDVVFGGNTYTATTCARASEAIAPEAAGRELLVYLLVSHPLAQRYLQAGIPPREVTVTVQRLQAVSGTAIQTWTGYATAIAVEGRVATLSVPPATADAWQVKLPVLAAQRTCNNVLYDAESGGQCGALRSAFNVATTAASGAGTSTVVVASMAGKPDQWAQFGELVHTASGERRWIKSQLGTTVVLNAPIVELANTDAVVVYAGCDHTVKTCRDKYAQVVNFIGMPDLNASINPFAPAGLGAVSQA